ncbi:hypothetical protein B0J12DRAFT_699351 [Macrophomina phaseolina]|uniref:Secreted protein n=1 Tax=Macrophomina phaseolina TaxID=35725 RepID=A0ABQ8GC43_9PEZI|nr:hypothetical protein B0J12DRAFT_699351 [Macrophomina phaseolina]
MACGLLPLSPLLARAAALMLLSCCWTYCCCPLSAPASPLACMAAPRFESNQPTSPVDRLRLIAAAACLSVWLLLLFHRSRMHAQPRTAALLLASSCTTPTCRCSRCCRPPSTHATTMRIIW